MSSTLARPVEHAIEIKKSRFIAVLAPVASRREAMAVLAETRARWPAATHYCWALLAGPDSGANDDGEPGGTAGRPMLNVLQHKKLANVIAIVVRYYGGIKLGAGGLVRAYSQAVSEAVARAEPVPIVARAELRLALDYPLENRVRHACQQLGIEIAAADYGARLVLVLRLPEAGIEAARARLSDLSQGQLEWLA